MTNYESLTPEQLNVEVAKAKGCGIYKGWESDPDEGFIPVGYNWATSLDASGELMEEMIADGWTIEIHFTNFYKQSEVELYDIARHISILCVDVKSLASLETIGYLKWKETK